jgi:hypothetical protein
MERARGDPGADGVENDLDLETADPMIEEQAIINIDDLVTDIDEGWENELMDASGDGDGR